MKHFIYAFTDQAEAEGLLPDHFVDRIGEASKIVRPGSGAAAIAAPWKRLPDVPPYDPETGELSGPIVDPGEKFAGEFFLMSNTPIDEVSDKLIEPPAGVVAGFSH